MVNLFINKKTKKQPKDRSEQSDSLLFDGMYQLPIFCQPFKKQEKFYVDDCYKYDKLPASSVLVRIKQAPMSEDGLKVLSINTPGFETKKKKEDYGIWELPPKYEFGAYNSALCGARQGEIDLAEIRRQRKHVETKSEVVNKLKPIYEDILILKKEEEELAKLPPKEREKEKKRRQSMRSLASVKALPSVNINQTGDKLPDKDEKKDDDKKDDKKDDDKKDDKKDDKDKNDDKKEDSKLEPPKSTVKDSLSDVKKDDKPANKKEELSNIPKSMANLDEVKPANAETNRSMKTKKEIEEEEMRDDEDIYTIIDTVFSFKKEMEFLNLKFFSKYRKEGGFKFIVDGIHNLPKKGFYITSYTLNPPAVYYTKEEKQDISVYSNFDWEKSTLKTIFYNEGYVKFKEIEFSPSLCFIIELSTVETPAFSDPEIKPAAWTILPVFIIDPLSMQGYVNSNIYQLPLFEGKMTKEIAETLQSGDPWQKVMELVKNKKAKYWSYASVYCRLLDIQRDGHFQKFFDYERASEEYLPDGKASDYRFLASDEEKIQKKKASWLREIIPYQEDPYTFNKRMTEVVSKEYGTYIEQK